MATWRGQVCERHGIWLHIDAAYGGAYAVCPEYRPILDGVEHADSLVINAHKKLFVSFDCALMWIQGPGAAASPQGGGGVGGAWAWASASVAPGKTARVKDGRKYLLQAFELNPEYLKNAATESREVIDYKDWQIALGRRFRALKLWFVLRSYGVEGIRAKIRNASTLAGYFESLLVPPSGSPTGFEVCGDRNGMGLVCFRAARTGLTTAQLNDLNERLLDAINATGELFLIHTKLAGEVVLRLAIGGFDQTEADIDHAWGVIRQCNGRLA